MSTLLPDEGYPDLHGRTRPFCRHADPEPIAGLRRQHRLSGMRVFTACSTVCLALMGLLHRQRAGACDGHGAALAAELKTGLSQQDCLPGLADWVKFTFRSARVRCCAGSALAPATAMAAMGQPSLQSFQQGADGNFNPTIQDWVTAYKPVDKALNKVFETRITNANARQVQFNLAVVRLPPPQHPSPAPANLSCMVAYGRSAPGITLGQPGLAEHQGPCKLNLAGPGRGAWLHAQSALLKGLWLAACIAMAHWSLICPVARQGLQFRPILQICQSC